MTPEIARRYVAEKVANTCNRVEGVPVSEKAKELSRQWVQGKITGDEMVQALIARHKKP